ncbi:hypothetical protein, partial [Stutzerimonas nitrititolerans]|uniref:hypothetical protein n=1 Tax=Stutzerimonas nitrititolerans TaxID=2482751 RepID=UPI00289B9BBE
NPDKISIRKNPVFQISGLNDLANNAMRDGTSNKNDFQHTREPDVSYEAPAPLKMSLILAPFDSQPD